MDFSKIKHLVKQSGDKFIFLEDGEPEIVVLSFHEYQKLLRGAVSQQTMPMRRPEGGYRAMPVRAYGPDYIESMGNEFEETEFIASGEDHAKPLPLRPEDIRLEDLPI
ncbi:MAG: hypothetical protein A2847_01035 [Candidatus Sungbacteria bacterium RIFCSPHIGHO2_01_FULL_50_25]|uniref:Antitoxin n=1 Tax=Candidatus Sungbacteria bacterium RIFCSPHIGHO2_01_FULL_50_25 TaxID=1802265 RepID=A0A1G2K7X9_9BACT|nr:MAG: hypothetical protein A2847_01035 [Candidatus Sungbacteria bacterium RIFCSPHIGHO2_01_FULL_50_25]